ncbi:MFS general substrate transporter [Russula brevipes]|nr:MFS general substrate transporter [Russula brevipes]
MSTTKKEVRTWSSYIWDTWNKSPEERRFLRRLDACLITYAYLSYFSKFLDQQNVINAYVSGMKEEWVVNYQHVFRNKSEPVMTSLHLHGNQLNYITTSWAVGYIIGQIPSNMLITRIRPSIWIPTMELIWSSLTMCLALSKNFSTLCAIRFLVGLAESVFYPAIQYVIGSWYKNEELAKRSCIFHTASALGPMVSGFLQAGIYNGLDGSGGIAGWRWLFIIDGVITIPIALLGYFIMPDLPSTTKPSTFYTQEQLHIAQKRMDSVGRKPPAKLTKKKVQYNLTLLAFVAIDYVWGHRFLASSLRGIYSHSCRFGNGGGGTTSMIFWLQSFNEPGHVVYTIGQINTYPLGIYALQIVTTLVYAWWSDAVMLRWPPILFAGIWSLITYVVLAAMPVYTRISLRWTFYYFTGCMGGIAGLIMTWVHELNSHDNEKRAFVVASCNMWGYVFQAWLPIILFPQVEQPRVFKGNVATACINFLMIVMTLVTLYFQRREQRHVGLCRVETPADVKGDKHESEVGETGKLPPTD